MPTLRRPLLDVCWQILTVWNGHQRRSIAIFKEIGLNADTEKNIEAYEQRHQRFWQALRGGSASKENTAVVNKGKPKNGTSKGDVNTSDTGASRQKPTPERRKEPLSSLKFKKKSATKIQTTGNRLNRRITSFNSYMNTPERCGFKLWKPPSEPEAVNRIEPEQKPSTKLPTVGNYSGPKNPFGGSYLKDTPEQRGFKRWKAPLEPEATAKAQQLQHTEFGTESTNPNIAPQRFKISTEHRVNSATPKPTLFEELFPEEVEKPVDQRFPDIKPSMLFKLPLPHIEEDVSWFEDEYVKPRRSKDVTADSASKDAYKKWNLAILVLQVASPSLTEDDFRRIAPKGQHIDDWVGLGDIFKVIPARNPTTLQQETHYFLVFPNPAYARAYQTNVRRLHNLAQAHTPTSISSPTPPPEGMLVQGEHVHDLLQNYTLLPPSQKMSLISLFPPYATGIQRLLERRGYPELTTPVDRTGRCVLFWVEGYVPSLLEVRHFVWRDSRARGLAWGLLDGAKNAIQQFDAVADSELEGEGEHTVRMQREEDGGQGQGQGQDYYDYSRRLLRRWTIAFEDENEARRFIRRWHLRPFRVEEFTEREGKGKGEVKPLIHAEFMW